MFILGSIYLLGILALQKAKVLVTELQGDQALRLAALIRCPSPGAVLLYYFCIIPNISVFLDTPEGRTVIRVIIPAIAKLRGLLDINMSAMFCPQMLSKLGLQITLKASNFKDSDKLFDNISYK